MTQTLLTVIAFVVLLACVPALLRWARQRAPALGRLAGPDSRVVSAVAVGPNQRVVTVEVGPQEARTWLVLGVTPQAIACLHVMAPAAAQATPAALMPAFVPPAPPSTQRPESTA